MDPAHESRVRVRHALRVATGAAAIAAVGLTTSVTASCLASVLFFVSTVAGTPHNLQGFQLRSAALTFAGAALGLSAYAVVAVAAPAARVPAFFAALPFVAFFAALRPDPRLVPLPPVANVVLGLLLISRFGAPRRAVPRAVALAAADAALAAAVAVLVNLVRPDTAAALARRLVARELRHLGALISRVATNTFAPAHVPAPHHDPADSTRHHLAILVEQGLQENAIAAGLLQHDYVFLTANVPPRSAATTVGLERTRTMVSNAERSLAFLHHLRPFGHTRVSDYANLALANQLCAASAYEPRIWPQRPSPWHSPRACAPLIDSLNALVTKVSSLESVSCAGPGCPSRFSHASLFNLFGEAYIPLWVSHYASCAAACAAMSRALCHATYADLFYLPGDSFVGVRGRCPLESSIDPRKWRRRRAEMYYGFLLRYRARMRNSQHLPHHASLLDLRSLESDQVRGLDLQYDLRASRDGLLDRRTRDSAKSLHHHARANTRESMAELQALSFFGVASHALSEEIGHVQNAMVALASSSDARGPLAPVYFLLSVLPDLWARVKQICTGNLLAWEVRFIFTHSLLLLLVLALALFLPLSETFEASEIAWVYTSAALAAQLSAEPTLFIGVIRVIATITGAALAFGFTSILDAAGRSTTPGIQYLMIPYMFLVTVVFLLSCPPSFRYAAFLVIVTNAIMLFCPRSTPECNQVFINQSSDCFPNWQYAISRTANVSIGVVFALVFHLLFWPRYANEEAYRSLSTAFINAARILGKFRRTYFSYGLDRRDWLKEPHGETTNHHNEQTVLQQASLGDGDLYQKEDAVTQALQEKVSVHVSAAILTVKAEAGVWRAGPLRLSPLLPRVLTDFIALDVSLAEMAALLGRRPIFSSSYGRSAHEHYINPLLPYYETIQVSLNNLVGIIHRMFQDTKNHSLRENTLDLHQAIAHLARMRSELRAEAEERSQQLEYKKIVPLHVREKLSSWSVTQGLDVTPEQVGNSSARSEGYRWPLLRRSRSTDNFDKSQPDLDGLSVDDVVMYNTFSFIADGCLSAFVRIAVTVLTDTESRLKAMNKKTE